jgi:pectinesterase
MESDSKMKIKYIVSILAFVVVSFITKAQVKYDFVVAKDGTGTFKTVQEAINAVPDFRKNQTTIFIKNGVYKEKLILATSKTNVKFVGEDAMKTIITNDDFAQRKNRFGEEMGTTGSSTFFVFGDDFSAENITFENSAGPVGQAVAVRIDGDRVTFNKCRFLGNQDTLYPHGEKSRQYYKDCYIEGTVDFIFGWSTAVFDNCTVFCKNNGYVTAASTLDTVRYGFVFINCKITGDAPANSFYLGRPWRPFAKTVFINCYLDKQIKPEGWHNWDKKDAESTSFYAEYKSKGPGANDKARVNWSHQLSDEEAKAFTLENIFRDWKVGDGKHK